MQMKRALHPTLVLMIVLTSTPLFGDLIVNGSFESPEIDGPFASFNAGSQSIPGWEVVGVSVAILENQQVTGLTFTAQDGDQLMDLSGLQSNSPNNGVIQNVTTTVGADYLLSFYVGSATGSGLYFASTVDLSIDGCPRTSFTNPTAPFDLVDWLQFTVPFTAQNSVTTIAFFNGSAANNFLCFLDNVTLNRDIKFLLGDVNGDGMTNLLDVAPFVNAITSGCYIENADINQDGVVSLLDVALFVDALTG
jgi:hypothetical protein